MTSLFILETSTQQGDNSSDDRFVAIPASPNFEEQRPVIAQN
jgi:hypothetical protein